MFPDICLRAWLLSVRVEEECVRPSWWVLWPKGCAWAWFDVSGTLLLTGVTIREQSLSPDGVDDPQGAAVQVHSGGRLVATGVSFANLVSEPGTSRSVAGDASWIDH
eukprot:COSAG06_NODE_4203_length_4481_cov_3.519651_6_plen_107_part_00